MLTLTKLMSKFGHRLRPYVKTSIIREEQQMRIRSRMGVSVDGFVSTPDGRPALLAMPDFVPGKSHGFPEFIARCDTVVMGRTTFLPAVSAPRWPWPGLDVYVLTSQPLPPEAPAEVIASTDGPAELVQRLRGRGSDHDVHLVGGPKTIQAFQALGALDTLEIILLPILLGDGTPLTLPGTPNLSLRLLGDRRTFPDGSVELAYSAKGA
jgi:dihydrofolate reductase